MTIGYGIIIRAAGWTLLPTVYQDLRSAVDALTVMRHNFLDARVVELCAPGDPDDYDTATR